MTDQAPDAAVAALIASINANFEAKAEPQRFGMFVVVYDSTNGQVKSSTNIADPGTLAYLLAGQFRKLHEGTLFPDEPRAQG